MKLPFWFAWRYFYSKEVNHVIHWIARVSQLGIIVCTAALIIVLSVFNGLENLIVSLYNTFDPDLIIIPATGKYFELPPEKWEKIVHLSTIRTISPVIEENVLLEYKKKQLIARARGIKPEFLEAKRLDTQIVLGKAMLVQNGYPMAIAGVGIASKLEINLYDAEHFLKMYYPNTKVKNIFLNPGRAFHQKALVVSGLFTIQEDYDKKFVLVPLDFMRELTGRPSSYTSIEIELKDDKELNEIQQQIASILGNDYKILNKNQQHASFYRIVRMEKLFSFLILAFIILIAAFNLIGSLLMLSYEKKKDMMVLSCLGADSRLIRNIFVLEGMLLSFSSAIIGLVLGVFVSWLQMKFGFVRLSGPEHTFIVDAYPVALEGQDILFVFITVIIIGIISTWLPAQSARKNLNIQDLHQ